MHGSRSSTGGWSMPRRPCQPQGERRCRSMDATRLAAGAKPVPKRVVEIQTDLLEHPAVKAWSARQPARVEPESIHVLREGRHTGLDVYRLTGVGPGGSTVIAKRCPTASIERTVYEEVIPHLPITVPRYYGSRE